MRSLAFAILLVACTPDVDQYPIIANTSPPAVAQAHESPTGGAAADSGVVDSATTGDGGAGDGGIKEDAGVIKDDALAGRRGDASSTPPFP